MNSMQVSRNRIRATESEPDSKINIMNNKAEPRIKIGGALKVPRISKNVKLRNQQK